MKTPALSAAIIFLVTAETASADRYALPRTKANIDPCRKAALERHPGQIKDYGVENRDGDLFFSFDIEEPDGSTWKIVCEGLTGIIVREQKQDVWSR